MTAGMAPRPGVRSPAEEDVYHRPQVERRPDYGNVVYIDCRRCGMPNLLDPARMENHKVGVFILCPQCGRRFLVRHTDIHRPDPGWVASLYTAVLPHTETETESPSRRKRILRRS
jgi:DNA-directed RNA polymerase subunit RPC12/RpoP